MESWPVYHHYLVNSQKVLITFSEKSKIDLQEAGRSQHNHVMPTFPVKIDVTFFAA